MQAEGREYDDLGGSSVIAAVVDAWWPGRWSEEWSRRWLLEVSTLMPPCGALRGDVECCCELVALLPQSRWVLPLLAVAKRDSGWPGCATGWGGRPDAAV